MSENGTARSEYKIGFNRRYEMSTYVRKIVVAAKDAVIDVSTEVVIAARYILYALRTL